MKILRANTGYNKPSGGYLYIFKHGIGPGTMPSDVHILKSKDLPKYYTAVWLDRFLTDDEMKQYDIPFETDINYYLDRIGYCQMNGDVVPCDDVNACDIVTAAKSSKADILDSYVGEDIWLRVKLSQKAYFRRGYTGNEYWIRIVDKDENGNYVINRVSSYKEYKGNSTQKQNTLSNTYTVDKNSITLYNPIQTATKDEIFNVEACDKVTASTKRHPKVPDGWDIIPEGDDDDGNWGTIAKEMPNNGGYYWINVDEDDNGKRCFSIEYAYRNSNGSVGKIWPISKVFYRLGDAVREVDRRINIELDDVDACDKVTSSTRYMANMVNADTDIDEDFDPKYDCKYHADSYFDGNYRGLEDVFHTDDPTELIDWVWEHAAKGGFVEVSGPKGSVRLDPDELAERVESGDIGEYEIISQIDYV